MKLTKILQGRAGIPRVARVPERAAVVSWLRSTGLIAGLAAILLLAGCNLFGGGGSSSNAKALTQVPWCDRETINFEDDSTSARTQFTNWSDVKDQLGFTTYLPASLPKGACLDLAGGSIHDPIFGATFKVTYTLPGTPDSIPLSFSEAPKHGNIGDKLQCVQNAQDTKANICVGAKEGTTISIASRQSQGDLQALFNTLQPNVEWVPTVASSPTATATK